MLYSNEKSIFVKKHPPVWKGLQQVRTGRNARRTPHGKEIQMERGKLHGLGSYLCPPVLFSTGSSFSRRLQQPRPVSAQNPAHNKTTGEQPPQQAPRRPARRAHGAAGARREGRRACILVEGDILKLKGDSRWSRYFKNDRGFRSRCFYLRESRGPSI